MSLTLLSHGDVVGGGGGGGNVTGVVQTPPPQPFLQHFIPPGHSSSVLQLETQGPGRIGLVIVGHWPGLTVFTVDT